MGADVRLSKFLSLVLRHDPERIGIELDNAGWASLDELLAAAGAHGMTITESDLRRVVTTNDKQRFTIDESARRIRANQGHSLDVDLDLIPAQPPAHLFHGTADRFLDAIMREGLRPMARHYVHLSPDRQTASGVGRRHGRLVILKVDGARMASDGCVYYRSANGVWLTDAVPPRYLEVVPESNPGL